MCKETRILLERIGMSESVKHDSGKLWAATVLAGFWPVIGEEAVLRISTAYVVAKESMPDIRWALDAYFDTNLPIEHRVVQARDHLPFKETIRMAVQVGHYGASVKYVNDNWLGLENGLHRYYEAGGRHIQALVSGEFLDSESNLQHLAHWIWCVYATSTIVMKTNTKNAVE
jgi:hypothetical protein